MANTHTTLTGLFTDTANAIRSKTGKTGTLVADNFPAAISNIEVKENLDSELSAQDSLIAQINTALAGKAGVVLPTLSNPAGAANVESGYQAIDGSGRLIAGTAVMGVSVKTPNVSCSSYVVTATGIDKVPNTFYLCLGTYNATVRSSSGYTPSVQNSLVIYRNNGGTINLMTCDGSTKQNWNGAYTASISGGNLVLTPTQTSSTKFIDSATFVYAHFFS